MPPLISSQRYIDPKIVARKAATFKVFVVRVLDVNLRGKPYRVIVDGHHNLAAARLVGVEPKWKCPTKRFDRIRASMSPEEVERLLINNLTDSNWYFMDTGEVVADLLPTARVTP